MTVDLLLQLIKKKIDQTKNLHLQKSNNCKIVSQLNLITFCKLTIWHIISNNRLDLTTNKLSYFFLAIKAL